ncbi:ribosomal protein S18-alanine N-acetyltransferase [Thermodesulfobacteriota bacterium]
MSCLVKICPDNFQDYRNQILEIENLSFQSPWSISSFSAELDKRVSQLWALTAENTLTGYICFWMFDDEVQLVNIAVHPKKRGSGFGHLLLKTLLEMSASKGIRNIWLEVRSSNFIARNLYHKLGFEAIGRRPKYYSGSNEDAIIMNLEISQKEQYMAG